MTNKPLPRYDLYALGILEWVFWKYLGLLALAFSLPVWPWVLFQFYDNTASGTDALLIDWGKQPAKGRSGQKMMYLLAHEFKPYFDFALECLEKQ